jgi:phosphatidylglycerophosphatase C
VIEDLGRLALLEPEIDLDGVPLIGAQSRALEREALLVARRDDLFELRARDRLSARRETVQHRIDIGPARVVEPDAERGGIVPQGIREQLRQADGARSFHSEKCMLVLVQTATVAETIARIDEQAREPGGAVASDGDGTLWSGDIGEDFFAAVLEQRRLLAVVHEPLVREAREHGLDASGDALEIAHRIHAAYLAGTFPEERVCEIMTWATAGSPRAQMDAFAQDVIRAVDLERRLHGEAIAIVEHARKRGIDVYLVSASPRPIVLAAAEIIGIPLTNVISATERIDDSGIVLAEVDRPIPYGAGKVTRLRQKLGARPLYAAMGDNAFDVALLSESRVPLAIRPKARLLERAGEVKDLVVLEQA